MQTTPFPYARKRISVLRSIVQLAFDAELILCSKDDAGRLLVEFYPPSPNDLSIAQRFDILLGHGNHCRVIYRNLEEFN